MDNKTLSQNKKSWDIMADSWFGSTALPDFGCFIPDENELKLFPDLKDKKVLDIGCGSGHSLKWCGDNGASELWGLDISYNQVRNAERFLTESGYVPKLFNAPMEYDCGLPKLYFDIIYSIYALGWTVDLQLTINNIATYLKKGGIFIFSWDHPLMHCITTHCDQLIFDGCYLEEDIFSYVQRGTPVTIHNRKMSSWINALANSGFKIERLVEETNKQTVETKYEFSSDYYAPSKAKMFPLSFIIKAEKI